MHGTIGGYTNHACRCRFCTAAGTAYQARAKAVRSAKGLADGDPRHGTPNGYGNWGCRCPECTAAWTAACRERRARRDARQPPTEQEERR